MKEKLDKFCKNYEMKIVNDSGRYARYHSPIFFSDPYRSDLIRDNTELKTETLYTIQIPESRLKTLMELENRFHNYIEERGRRDMFEILMEKEREEAFYRNSNESVRKAFEQYSLMLHLAGYDKKV